MSFVSFSLEISFVVERINLFHNSLRAPQSVSRAIPAQRDSVRAITIFLSSRLIVVEEEEVKNKVMYRKFKK